MVRAFASDVVERIPLEPVRARLNLMLTERFKDKSAHERRLERPLQEVILDHNRNPRNFRALPDANRRAEGDNPLCGDHFTVFLKLDNDVIRDVSFQGAGCAISKASASLMTSNSKERPWPRREVASPNSSGCSPPARPMRRSWEACAPWAACINSHARQMRHPLLARHAGRPEREAAVSTEKPLSISST